MTFQAEAFELSWHDLSYVVGSSKGRQHQILKGISGKAQPMRLLAVLGGSGAGKTTFLNAIGSRLRTDKTHVLTGTTSIGNNIIDGNPQNMAFVTQDDIVFDTATPKESLYFSARVRAGLNPKEAEHRTDDVLNELMLTDVKDTVLGTPGLSRGVSGGERKRTNIGVELITDPKIILLDEPTSGLDSFTAEKVMRTLQSLARGGRTVICTIHQPSADIFSLFDDLMLMIDGEVVYHGTSQQSIAYFASIGYECPQNYTPTDFFMVLMQDDEKKHVLIEAWGKCVSHGTISLYQPPSSTVTHEEKDDTPHNERSCTVMRCILSNNIHRANCWTQFYELLVRSFRNYARNRHFLAAQFGQSIIFGLVVGLVFINLGTDQTSVQDRMGLFFMLSTNVAFAGASSVINTFTVEKSVFIREQQSQAYSPVCYFFGKTFGETPFHIFFSFLSITLIYFLTGLTLQLSTFLCFTGTVMLGYQSGVSLGLFLGAVCPNFFVSSALLPVVLVPMLLAGGLAVSSSRMGKYWLWLQKISTVQYTFTALAKFEFSNIARITCDESKFPGRCAFMYQSGADVLQRFGLMSPGNEMWALLLSLAGILIVLRLFAVLALYRLSRTKV